MKRLEISAAVRHIYMSLGFKRLMCGLNSTVAIIMPAQEHNYNTNQNRRKRNTKTKQKIEQQKENGNIN